MERKEILSRAVAVFIALLIIILYLVLHIDYSDVGVYAGCPLSARLLHPFFHAGVVHAALNAWCLLCIVFYYGVAPWQMAAAYLIAVSFPAGLFGCCVPTVGLSGVIFALMGSLSSVVRRKLYWQLWMGFFLVAGFLLPGTNPWIHLYCYVLGVVISLLMFPVRIGGDEG